MTTLETLASRTTPCGCARPRRTVTDYVLAPCRASRTALPAPAGERIAGPDGVGIRIHATLRDSAIETMSYEASSCATLVAYAEVLGDLVVGRSIVEAAVVDPRTLVDALPGVPRARQDRATLVARAWASAVAMAWQAEQGNRGGE
ncbi:MAG: iron-sulfur cluster assembly scaffold protein [Dehalococcoidia bacterium]